MLAHGVVGKKLDFFGRAVFKKELFDFLHFLFGIVDGRNYWDSYPDSLFCRHKPFEVFKNQLVAYSGIMLVLLSVKALDVVKEKVGIWYYPLKAFTLNVPCGVNGGVNAVFLALFEYFFKKVDLKHTFSARKGHTAARSFVKRLVFQYLTQNLVNGVFLAADFSCILWAKDRAFFAKIAGL